VSKLVIRQYKSAIGAKESARETLASLGLRRPGNVVVREDSPSLRGQIRKIAHLVAVSEDRRKERVDVESERRASTSAGGALKDDAAKTRIGAS
jgi:large subunit ribosomal protein L30